jgi:GT2 family glycosyltransferase
MNHLQQQPLVAIVILNYNGAHYLQQFLPSVLASTYGNKKIILADNASTDASALMLQNRFPEVTINQNTKNEGFAGGYNWALQQVNADYFVLLNSDVSVTENWIEPIFQLMESNDKIAACQPKLLSFHAPSELEYAGACGGWIDTLGYPFAKGRVFDTMEQDKGQYNDVEPVFWASGATLFVKSVVFKNLNGFTASFFAHQEEIELCWRMQLAGYSVYVCPQSVVYNVGAGTLQKGSKKLYLNFRNNLLMSAMHLPKSDKIKSLFIRFLLDAISAWKGLFTGNFSFFTAVLKAHIYVMLHWQQTQFNSENKKPLKQLKGVYNGSIVWQYFFKQKKTFSEVVENKHA